MMMCNHSCFEALNWLIKETTLLAYNTGRDGCLSACEVTLDYESECNVKGFCVNIFFIYNPTIHTEMYLSWDDVFMYKGSDKDYFQQMIYDTLWNIHTKAMKENENNYEI
jgi:hypothetical protein